MLLITHGVIDNRGQRSGLTRLQRCWASWPYAMSLDGFIIRLSTSTEINFSPQISSKGKVK